MNNEKIIQSYVLNRWFVSTIRRDSSAVMAPDVRYCETMVWEWTPEMKADRGALIGQSESCSSDMCGIKGHFEVCERLVRDDGWKDEDDC